MTVNSCRSLNLAQGGSDPSGLRESTEYAICWSTVLAPGHCIQTAVAGARSRPARPACWIVSMSVGEPPKWTTMRTSLMSTPVPAPLVPTRISRLTAALANAAKRCTRSALARSEWYTKTVTSVGSEEGTASHSRSRAATFSAALMVGVKTIDRWRPGPGGGAECAAPCCSQSCRARSCSSRRNALSSLLNCATWIAMLLRMVWLERTIRQASGCSRHSRDK